LNHTSNEFELVFALSLQLLEERTDVCTAIVDDWQCEAHLVYVVNSPIADMMRCTMPQPGPFVYWEKAQICPLVPKPVRARPGARCACERKPSFAPMCSTCASIVRSETTSLVAMARLVSPRVISSAT
jgi:hypothetical protein